MSMNVSLGELEQFVQEKVACGEYDSDSQVLCDGLRLLKQRDERWAAEVSAKVEEGLASLRAGRAVSAEVVSARAEELIAQVEQQHAGQ